LAGEVEVEGEQGDGHGPFRPARRVGGPGGDLGGDVEAGDVGGLGGGDGNADAAAAQLSSQGGQSGSAGCHGHQVGGERGQERGLAGARQTGDADANGSALLQQVRDEAAAVQDRVRPVTCCRTCGAGRAVWAGRATAGCGVIGSSQWCGGFGFMIRKWERIGELTHSTGARQATQVQNIVHARDFVRREPADGRFVVRTYQMMWVNGGLALLHRPSRRTVSGLLCPFADLR
jgi:hypothetical protein